eukprot:TRINITY_DN23598_c0_g1_i1.p1 TRINITY_DN23598_c0_g1~~TRINITY_DN23598_c0_g1_i1.p1  ORF type:complete len:1095 (+),score=245.29 TRINITY_DN23598_c0_g1_i1:277-3285(+)
MVAGTAYATAKGQLIRAILFPKPSKFDFEQKLYYFVANLAVFLVVGASAIIFWQWGERSALTILAEIINLLTITIPPQLPLALSIGLSFSFTRLQKGGVRCISPGRILAGGRVNLTAFDKTGTLTLDGLSLRGVCPVEGAAASSAKSASASLGGLLDRIDTLLEPPPSSSSTPSPSPPPATTLLYYTLAACHSIALLLPEHEDDSMSLAAESPPSQSWWDSWTKLWPRAKESGLPAYVKQPRPSSPRSSELSGEVEAEGEGAGEAGGKKGAEFIGDPLEVEIFSKTGLQFLSRPEEKDVDRRMSDVAPPAAIWSHPHMHASVDVVVLPDLEAAAPPLPALGIFRRFDFDADLRLMSTVVVELLPPREIQKGQRPRFWLLTKGAPESVVEHCRRDSLPGNREEVLQALALNGDRVLACAFKSLTYMSAEKILSATRQQMECDLTLSGLAVLENKLKEETAGYLAELSAAGLRSVMITGDNPLTAIAVARKCGPYFVHTSGPLYLVDASPDGRLHWADETPAGQEDRKQQTGCVVRNLATQREIPLDLLFSANGWADVERGRAVGAATEESGRGVTLPPDVGGEGESSQSGPASLAVTGRAFEALQAQHEALQGALLPSSALPHPPTPLEMVLVRAGVFARMTPRNKLGVVHSLQALGYTVCMTGDGANDSSALKAADVGISIASSPDEKSSVAAAPSIAAPFSTHIANIGPVGMVLGEGRCALVNATTMFKYMYFYALIQTTAVLLLYSHDRDLGENQYLYGDMFCVFALILVLPGLGPQPKLSRGLPEGNLLAPPILVSVYGQSVILIAFQVVAFLALQAQPWYVYDPAEAAAEKVGTTNVDSTLVFLVSSFQYTTIAMALCQSFGLFRSSPFRSFGLCFVIVLQLVCSSFLILSPPKFAISLFKMVSLGRRKSFLLFLWELAILNGMCFIAFERYLVRHMATDPSAVEESEASALQDAPPGRQVTVASGKAGKLPRFAIVRDAARLVWRPLNGGGRQEGKR